jgi:hypothetical protein
MNEAQTVFVVEQKQADGTWKAVHPTLDQQLATRIAAMNESRRVTPYIPAVAAFERAAHAAEQLHQG